MGLYDRLKHFLGLTGPQDRPNHNNEERRWTPHQENRDDDFAPPFWQDSGRNFDIFTDPLEMHRYFEQQMSDLLKNFGFSEFEDGFSFRQGLPELEDAPGNHDDQPGTLREQFLKPGYQRPLEGGRSEKKDEDLDGRIDVHDWGSVLGGENQRQVTSKTFTYGQSVTSKTVRNADGSIETHRSVKDNEGNEETTVTRKVGDKEHTVIKRRNKDGKEETVENLINMDEKDMGQFFPKQQPQSDQSAWPFFDKFFKPKM